MRLTSVRLLFGWAGVAYSQSPPIQNSDDNDDFWQAAMDYADGRQSREYSEIDRQMPQEDIVIPSPPITPSKFAMKATFTSIYGESSPFQNTPLVYTFARSGDKASITDELGDSILFFQVNDFNCQANETSSQSYMIGNFQTMQEGNDGVLSSKSQRICFRAPPGHIINTGLPAMYKSLLAAWVYSDEHSNRWSYAGMAESKRGSVYLWMRKTFSEQFESVHAPTTTTVMATLASDYSPVYFQTRLSTLQQSNQGNVVSEVKGSTRIEVQDFKIYDEEEEVVPSTVLSEEFLKECAVMIPEVNTKKCTLNQNQMSDNERAMEAFVESVFTRGLGLTKGTVSVYPNTSVPYDIIGDQEMVLSLPYFVPPMNNRSYMTVRDQGHCGSCYSFAAAEVISSQYSQANPGTSFQFSIQQIMDCLPLWNTDMLLADDPDAIPNWDPDGIPVYVDAGVQCWGGDPTQVIDWLVATGSKMDLITTIPYIGSIGTCNLTENSIDTGITGYSRLKTVEEMKNALYYRGDVSILLQVDEKWYEPAIMEADVVEWPKFLGVGLSYPAPGWPGHAITVIGWGACQVPQPAPEIGYPCGVPGVSPLVIGECWIVQNSWGTGWGYNGYFFVDTNPECDTGVLTLGAIIPRRRDEPPPVATAPTSPLNVDSLTIDSIWEKDLITCGIATTSAYNDIPNTQLTPDFVVASGFDVEFCKAFAAAILGDETKFLAVPVMPDDRFQDLQNGVVDVVSGTTHTMQRDVYMTDFGTGFSFATVTLYDGLKFAGVPEFVACAENGDVESGNCSNLLICVQRSTTWVDVVAGMFPQENYVLSPGIGRWMLKRGECNVIAGENSNVAEQPSRDIGYEGEWAISSKSFSKEPLAWMTRQDDVMFSDIINWIIMALMTAEEEGITQANAHDFGTFNGLGQEYENMFINAIAAVGNFGEIWDRELESITPRNGLNLLNLGASGRLYSHPLGAVDELALVFPDGTLAEIIEAGVVHCGVGSIPNTTDSSKLDLYDVEYCRALSAALFAGDPNRVKLYDVSFSTRFPMLVGGTLNVLSAKVTVTLDRDVYLQELQSGLTFATPNFYDGQAFGGIPTFVECAENQLVEGNCSNLKVCTFAGTASAERTSNLLPGGNIVPKPTTLEMYEGLMNGHCNVITTDSVVIAEGNVRAAGYEGEYVVGGVRYSKEPLALTTTQDDPVWSDFVNWVVQGLVYAEENGITQETAADMPTVNVFGPRFQSMLKDAVGAVGNFGEIYERHMKSSIPRSGLNLLNDQGGPQIYPYPGF